jgi:hypothetical protein
MSGRINSIPLLDLGELAKNMEKEFISCVLKTNDRNVDWIIGTPLICHKTVLRTLDNEDYKSLTLVTTPFCPKAGTGRKTTALHVGSLHPRSEKPIVETLKIIETEELRLSAVEELNEYVKNERPVSLVLPDSKEGRERIPKMLKLLSHKHYPELFCFCVNLLQGNHDSIPAQEGDEIISVITLIDIRKALAIFDPTKANGIAVIVENLNKKALVEEGRRVAYDEMFLVYAHSKENVIFVDGRAINPIGNMSSDQLGGMNYLSRRPLVFAKKPTGKKSPDKKGKPEESQGNIEYRYSGGMSSGTTYYSTTTSTDWTTTR